MSSSGKHLIVSLHDAHPGSWEDIMGQLDFLAALGVSRTSILVIPEYHHEHRSESWDGERDKKLRQLQAAGHELVLHGYFHDIAGQIDTIKNYFWTQIYTSREAEFLDLLDTEAEKRLRSGMDLFHKHDWHAHGFIAPAWLMSPKIPALLEKLGFLYTNRLTEIIPFRGKARIPSQSLCYSTRAMWRRAASLGWNRNLFARLRGTALIRLSLHPRDLHFAPIKSQIEDLVKTALREGFQPTTYAEYVAR